MRDYYYILGVSKDATTDEIKQAYRKLSFKFHPDKNGGDPFFEERFKEISAAYRVLSNSEQKTAYDKETSAQSVKKEASSSAVPTPEAQALKIVSFSCDKQEISVGEDLTFKWHVKNATSVELKPFGMVNLKGQKKVKIFDFNSVDNLKVLLIARNEDLSDTKKVIRMLTIKKANQPFFEDKDQHETYNLADDFDNLVDHNPPKITVFKVNKTRAKNGDTVLIEWSVSFARYVELKPFGKVASTGFKAIVIDEAQDFCLLTYELVASNFLKTGATSVVKRKIEIDVYSEQKKSQNNTKTSQQSTNHSGKPKIAYFSADRLSADFGDSITFVWKVENARSIELRPFGFVDTSGSKTIKVDSTNYRGNLLVRLFARNDEHTWEEEKIEISVREDKKPLPITPIPKAHQKSWWKSESAHNILGIIIFWLLYFFAYPYIRNTFFKGESKTDNVTTSISAPQSVQKLVESTPSSVDSVGLEDDDQISKFKGNRLKNGSSPFTSCFQKAQRGGKSWIEFQNRNDVDAVVCLINSQTGGTIRNEYVQAGANFKMLNVPDGMYYIKAVFGNDWNPALTSPCGSQGFFESNISFSISDQATDTINIESFDDGVSSNYSTHTVTLYSVSDGNMSQRSIEPSEFFDQ